MEEPKKIYLFKNPISEEVDDRWLTNRSCDDDVEYIRTDAFVEKAENFIYSALNDGIMGTANIEDFMRLFKNYMKGE